MAIAERQADAGAEVVPTFRSSALGWDAGAASALGWGAGTASALGWGAGASSALSWGAGCAGPGALAMFGDLKVGTTSGLRSARCYLGPNFPDEPNPWAHPGIVSAWLQQVLRMMDGAFPRCGWRARRLRRHPRHQLLLSRPHPGRRALGRRLGRLSQGAQAEKYLEATSRGLL